MSKASPDARSRANVLTVPAGVPFLETIADDLLRGGLLPGVRLDVDPLGLADVAIYLPTRRAVRELEAIFTERLGGAAILPRVAALGDFGEEDDPFDSDADGLPGPQAAISETERRLALADLIRAWARSISGALRGDASEVELISTSPSEAMSLAIELGGLIDSFETEGVAWEKLAGLVPPEHDRIWELTTRFLNIAAEVWPARLAERGLIGGAARRNKQLTALASRLAENPPSTPFIIAGSTGSNPATAELMKAVAHLPLGAVVLQGLDTEASDDIWKEIGGKRDAGPVLPQTWTHPQYGFHRLLEKLDVQRGEVGVLGKEDRARDARRALVSRALLPADRTDEWANSPLPLGPALDAVTLIEAANEREEALAIALALRETLEEPDRTVALITPDRTLARRVVAELKRWDIHAEDSAGRPLADSQAGILARLVVETAVGDLGPAELLALLKHPDACFGMDGKARHRAAGVLEIGVLRGPAPPPGAKGLREAIALARLPAGEDRHMHQSRRELAAESWTLAEDLVARLEQALEPLCALGRGGRETLLVDFLSAHREALAAVATKAEEAEVDPDRLALGAFFDEALAASTRMRLRLVDYPAVFKTMLRGRTSRPRRPGHPRLRILGTLEARLLGFDRTVLGGLIEGVWPPQTRNDAFLSRPMRGALGLPPPEWRVGLSAHDFEQALGGGDVVVTRALKAGGAPTVAARWLQRLAAVSGEAWKPVKARGETLLAYASALDEAETKRIGAPAPCPPTELRPKRLSVTEIETLIRDPYAIYARHVLKLRPLDPVGTGPEASDRGTIVHGALAEYVEKEDPFAPDAVERLCAIGREAFEPIWDYPDVRALWWPRFERIARWFVDWERERRRKISGTFLERSGKITWTTSAKREFTLSGRADRIDSVHGGYAVLDYKTGRAPTDKEVGSGFAPQLPLEAAMLAAGAFDDTPAGGTADLIYVQLSGQAEPGKSRSVAVKDKTAAEVADEALAELKTLIDRFEDPMQPYRSGTHPKFKRRPNGDYDHLARLAEWSLAPDADEGSE
ncbi:double-strand break repair protein AddB [Flaviflagellibacter deserti]|uniref:Double-strand break repair protein AddB n=1 Tax=Flaviflagellibacter deserti TaxID=2267266 RepID=A0ABV9YZL9_9HYPH